MGKKVKIKQQRKDLRVIYGDMQLQARIEAAQLAETVFADILQAMDKIMLIMLCVRDCDYLAAIWRGDTLKEKLPEIAAGDLMKMLTEIAIIFERLNVPIEPVRELVFIYVNGIKAIHNDNDDGALIRGLDTGSLVSEIIDWRQTINQGGRPTGAKDWRRRLKERWIHLEQQFPGDTAGGIRVRLIKQIADEVTKVREGVPSYNNQSGKWQLKDGTDEDDRYIFNSLMGDTALKRPVDYRYDLMKVQ